MNRFSFILPPERPTISPLVSKPPLPWWWFARLCSDRLEFYGPPRRPLMANPSGLSWGNPSANQQIFRPNFTLL